MFSPEQIPQAASQLSISDTVSAILEEGRPVAVTNKLAEDSLYFSQCMQLIWNEVNRLTGLGVIRSEEDKWFFAYRKAIGILSGDK